MERWETLMLQPHGTPGNQPTFQLIDDPADWELDAPSKSKSVHRSPLRTVAHCAPSKSKAVQPVQPVRPKILPIKGIIEYQDKAKEREIKSGQCITEAKAKGCEIKSGQGIQSERCGKLEDAADWESHSLKTCEIKSGEPLGGGGEQALAAVHAALERNSRQLNAIQEVLGLSSQLQLKETIEEFQTRLDSVSLDVMTELAAVRESISELGSKRKPQRNFSPRTSFYSAGIDSNKERIQSSEHGMGMGRASHFVRRTERELPFEGSIPEGECSAPLLTEENVNRLANEGLDTADEKCDEAPCTVSPPPHAHSRGSGQSSDVYNAKPGKARKSARLCGDRFGPFLDRVWQFLEDAESSKAAFWYRILMQKFIVISSLVTLSQTFENSAIGEEEAVYMEVGIDLLFTIEILVRFSACPTRARVFFKNAYNLVDCCAPAILILRAFIGFGILDAGGNVVRSLLTCMVPVLRMCRTLRHFEKFALLRDSFLIVLEALPVIAFVFWVMAMVFASAFYISEDRINIPTLADALYLSVITMTTVGYGDITPQTTPGMVTAAILATVSGLYMSIPYGIIGQTFNQAWGDRDRLLVMHRTRERLDRWGYSSQDIEPLFQQFDLNEDGELDVDEFRLMISDMGIGLSDERAVELFKAFDADGSGSVDCGEFVSILFPSYKYA